MASVACTGPAELAVFLSELSATIEAFEIVHSAVPLSDYPGGPRPSSVVRLLGRGHVGLGENVAFEPAEHARFARSANTWFQTLPKHTPLRIGTALGAYSARYERAALEAALIDLALRQAALSLADLTGTRAAALSFVASFAAGPKPARVIAELRAAGHSGDFKVDVDLTWDQATLASLANEPSIAILDFKTHGAAQFAARLAECVPRALLEDPPIGFEALAPRERQRVSRDAPLNDANAVAGAVAAGEAVNLKAPRMGGPLEVLRGLEHARRAGTRAYLGGMFEVSVGRAQAQQLAALFCPSAPNDLAPNVPSSELTTRPRSNSPLGIRLDEPGFGSALTS